MLAEMVSKQHLYLNYLHIIPILIAARTHLSGISRTRKVKQKMSPKILQVDYKFHASKAELEQALLAEAHAMADTPGMRWKIWWMNDAESEGGGVHLAEDDAAVQAFVAGPVVAAVSTDPNFSNMSAKIFDVLPEPTIVTRRPV